MLFENKVTPEFTNKVQSIADSLNMNPDWLMYVMNNESAGTFSPSVKNPGSTATGLIQFLSSTAAGLGTSTAALAKMSAIDQLDYVQKYFQKQIQAYGPINSVSDTYLAVFYPAAISWSDTNKKFSDTVYSGNKIFDYDGLGYLTKGDFQDYVNFHYSKVGGSDSSSVTTSVDNEDNNNSDDSGDIPPISADSYNADNIVLYAGLGVFVSLCIILIFLFAKKSKNE